MTTKANDFHKIMVRNVAFLWPRLDQPYRYNNATKRTEACAASATNAGYSLAWEMLPGDATKLRDECIAHYNACRARNTTLPEFGKIFGAKKDDAKGVIHFTAKKRAMSSAGTETKPPTVVDAQLQPLADKAIWTGSEGNVRVLAFPTVDPEGVGGISLLLDVVQVVKPVYGGDGLEGDFEAVAAPIDDDLGGFDGGATSKPAPAHTAPGPVAQAAAPKAAAVPADAPW